MENNNNEKKAVKRQRSTKLIIIGYVLIGLQIMSAAGLLMAGDPVINWVHSSDPVIIVGNILSTITGHVFAIAGVILLVIGYRGKPVPEDKE